MECLNFLMMVPDEITDTVIVKIPKGNNPQCLNFFRHISLCNIIYSLCFYLLYILVLIEV